MSNIVDQLKYCMVIVGSMVDYYTKGFIYGKSIFAIYSQGCDYAILLSFHFLHILSISGSWFGTNNVIDS